MCGQSDNPYLLREQVLIEIHEGHTGIVRMKAVARMHAMENWTSFVAFQISSAETGRLVIGDSSTMFTIEF